MRSPLRAQLTVGCALALLGAVLIQALLTAGEQNPLSAVATGAEVEFTQQYCGSNTRTSVPSGSEAEARRYYRDLRRRIGFRVQDPPPNRPGPTTTLEDVLLYLGYRAKTPATAISAQELQDSSPGDLMDPRKLGERLGGVAISGGDVLVARFFAPKISDVSEQPVKSAGWRKLVRLRSLPSSAAASNRIESGIVLFNFFAALDNANPFAGNDSLNTQIILVRKDAKKSLYWLDFGKTSTGAKLNHQLDAFFDAGHIPTSVAKTGGPAAYFVPCACVSCHGGLRFDFTTTPPAPDNRFRAPLLDYLDTDHWFDRTQKGDDFEGLVAPVLFDPGTFEVILLINEEIRQQNVAAQPDSVLGRAAEHWLVSHLDRGREREPIFERSLQRAAASPVWNSNDPIDAELLPKLNRLCFRCHGTVLFDVFDKESVLKLKSNLNASLFPRDQIADKRAAMPPDRDLSAEELRTLRELILRLK